MKILLAICILLTATSLWAAQTPAPVRPGATIVKGEVLEVQDAGSYVYLRLKTKDGESWAAVGWAPVKKGALVTIENATVMTNFNSKSLKTTFPKIIFGNLAGAGEASPHANVANPADTSDIRVAKASGANARTVAEILTKGAELKDKPVLVRGKIVKYNPGIMGKNWIHLRDGSGTAVESTNDLLVTTTDTAKAGDVVTVKGVVHTNKDFGAGYSYKVVIEEATLQK